VQVADIRFRIIVVPHLTFLVSGEQPLLRFPERGYLWPDRVRARGTTLISYEVGTLSLHNC